MTRLSASGVYAITNNVNGLQYVGSALNFSNRWKQHRFHLNRGTHHNEHLSRAWTKYGSGAFTFSILEVVNDVVCLLEREQWYLDTLKPAYNQCLVAGSALGRPQTAKQRAAMAEFNKRQVFTPERLARMSQIASERWAEMPPEERDSLVRRMVEGRKSSSKHAAARKSVGEKLRGRRLNISDAERERRRQRSKGLTALRWAKVRAAQQEGQPTLWE